jgi:hypothetical protein
MSLTAAIADEQSSALLLGSTLSNTGQETSFHLAPRTSRLGMIAALIFSKLLIPQFQADIVSRSSSSRADADWHRPPTFSSAIVSIL